jgi:hypothetical protein
MPQFESTKKEIVANKEVVIVDKDTGEQQKIIIKNTS